MPCKLLRVSIIIRIVAAISMFVTHVGAVTEKVIYTFHGAGDGSLPFSNLIFDKAGNLYGTTSTGGSAACVNLYGKLGCGTVFELSPNSSGGWTETVLYSFQGGRDGMAPGNIVFDGVGDIYGTTWGGGVGTCFQGCGTVFKLSRSHGVWTESVLYRFQGGTDGFAPIGVIRDASGNVFGVTNFGGNSSCNYTNYGCGVLFELSQSTAGTWNKTLLHTFGSTATDGQNPNSGLLFDRNGNLYGSAQSGGTSSFYGIIFEFTPNAGVWSENILYNFVGGHRGSLPMGGLIFGPAGRLYGAAYFGGTYDAGVVFEAASTSNGWEVGHILSFGGAGNGMNPMSLLSTDPAGNLYGTTEYGGTTFGLGSGTVYKVSPTSTNGWTGTVIYAFSGGADGGTPLAGVVVDSSGNIYGTAYVGGLGNCEPYFGRGCGVVFEITP